MDTAIGCPRCYSTYFHRSHLTGWLRVFSLIGIRPRRCMQCFSRFWI
jgi:hypothetical protein